MGNEIQTRIFEGYPISFEKRGNDTMVNATEMARKYEKQVAWWLRLESTKEYMTALEKTVRNPHSLIETREGRNGGTWLHRNAALELARWLDPMLAVWMNEQVLTLMTEGKVELPIVANNNASNIVPPTLTESLNVDLRLLDYIKTEFRLSESSVAERVNEIAERWGLTVRVPYVESKGAVRAAKDLLAIHCPGMLSQEFNKIMKQHGYIEYLPRTKSNGKVEFYPSLTVKGEEFGKNDECSKCKTKTQPHYYIGKFVELLHNVGLKSVNETT